MFSRSAHYAVQAVLYIAMHSSDKKMVGLLEITEQLDIPKPFLGKILQTITKHGILKSTKGPGGGFALKVPAKKLTLLEIIKVIDGMTWYERCGLGFKTCSDEMPCPIHVEYNKVKEHILEILTKETIADLVQEVEEGKSFIIIPEF